jgi:hypothetical protein
MAKISAARGLMNLTLVMGKCLPLDPLLCWRLIFSSMPQRRWVTTSVLTRPNRIGYAIRQDWIALICRPILDCQGTRR